MKRVVTANNERTIRFGVFEADLRTGELRRSGRRIGLQDQPFRVLALLLERPGELVSRDELKDRIWADDTLIDFDHALTTAVKKLRRVLHDSATHPRYVETLPKRGYRFIGPVEQRFSDEGVAREAVEPAAGESLDAGRIRRQRNALVGVLAAALMVLLLLIGWWPGGGTELPVRRFSFTPEDLGGPSRRHVVISPDGQHVAYLAGRGRKSLWIRSLSREKPRLLAGTAGASVPFWSPDSEFIFYGTRAELRVISIHGGTAQTICPLPGDRFAGGACSPDGETIVFSAGMPPALYEVPRGNAIPDLLFEPVAVETGSGNDGVIFLPPNVRRHTILFTAGGPGGREMMARDLDSGELTVLGRGRHPVYSPSGYVLFQAASPGGGIWALPFSGDALAATGPAEPLVDGAFEPSLAEDGTLVYVDPIPGSGRQELVLMDRTGRRLGAIGQPQDGIGTPEFSPDGTKVVVSGAEAGEVDIWLHDVAGATKARLTHERVVEGDPIWSPQGDEIVYRADWTLETELCRLDLAPSREPEQLPATGMTKRPNDWSPDGKLLVYTAGSLETKSDLWVVSVESGEPNGPPRPLIQTPFNEVCGRISPDGRWLAYSSDETGRHQVYVTTFPDASSRWQVSTSGGLYPRWTKGGRELVYVDQDRLVTVPVKFAGEFLMGPAEELFRDRNLIGSSASRSTYDISADGGRIVLREAVEVPEAKPISIHVVQNWLGAFGDRLGVSGE